MTAIRNCHPPELYTDRPTAHTPSTNEEDLFLALDWRFVITTFYPRRLFRFRVRTTGFFIARVRAKDCL